MTLPKKMQPLSLNHFLKTHGWDDASTQIVASDASPRRYMRLTKNGATAILMDAVDTKEAIKPFALIGSYLKQHKLHAPEIYAFDVDAGYMLLEDLGDEQFTSYLEQHPEDEAVCYKAALDVLIKLHQAPALSSLDTYSNATFLSGLEGLFEWYLPHLCHVKLCDDAKRSFFSMWESLLDEAQLLVPTVVLRDYHSPNLLWRPSEKHLDRVGVIDFQDAVLGPPTYDIVSLLLDARRDCAPELETELLSYYFEQRPGVDQEMFLASYAILGVQRNTRLLGFVARKLYKDRTRAYTHMLPRLWRYLESCLEHPLLVTVQTWFEIYLPEHLRIKHDIANDVSDA